MMPPPPQIRKAKRKVLVTTTTNHLESGGDRSFKKVKCDYTVVSKDIEEVEYYEDGGDGGGGGYAKKKTEEFCDEIYEDVQIYEENYGFPRQINGQLYYVDLSNFVFDFDSKELIGKLNSSGSSNILLFRQDIMQPKKKYMTEIVKII